MSDLLSNSAEVWFEQLSDLILALFLHSHCIYYHISVSKIYHRKTLDRYINHGSLSLTASVCNLLSPVSNMIILSLESGGNSAHLGNEGWQD